MDRTKVDVKDIFGERLGDLISKTYNDSGKNRDKQGEEMGIESNTLGTYIRGSRLASIEKLLAIADYYNVSTDWLLGRTKDPSMNPCATDELGLTPKAISVIQQMRRDNQVCWYLDALNAILEQDEFLILFYYLILFATSGDKTTDANVLKTSLKYKDIYQMKLNDTMKDIASHLATLFENRPDNRDMYNVYLSLYMHKMPDGRYCTLEEIQRDFADMGLEFDPLLFEDRERLGYMP